MKKLRALDLFCGAGGASMGLHKAGFDVTGIDINKQPHYPFKFIQADATNPPIDISKFDFIWASPPCQKWSRMNNIHKIDHPMLIDPVRNLLKKSGKPYCIENVVDAPLLNPTMLCGTMFGLKIKIKNQNYELRRHRNFESNIFFITPPCRHELPVIGIYGHGESKPMREKRGFQISQVEHRRRVMDMAWANRDEIAEAIPPAYGEFIGRHAIKEIGVRNARANR